MRRSTFNKLCTWLMMLALTLGAPVSAWAQCAMCKSAAENMDPASMKHLNFAILLLLMPPVAAFCGLCYLTYKHRDAPQDQLGREAGHVQFSKSERD